MDKQMPHRIVITGGPCAGKTTVLAMLRQKLGDFGFKVCIVPEVATELINSGITPEELGVDNFQKQVLLHTMEKENRWLESISCSPIPNDRIVILYDRGTMDGRAYMYPLRFDVMISRLGFKIAKIRDARYDAVIHMRTAALGAEEHYTLANNPARSESSQKAREVDEKTLQAWTGHPHVKVIESTQDILEKKNKVFKSICRIVGIPEPLEIERKYLIKENTNISFGDLGATYQSIEIIQHYLKSEEPNTEKRIRARGQDRSWVYYYTEKKLVKPGVRLETEHQISQDEYLKFLHGHLDYSFNQIQKLRTCFLWQNQYFELDEFVFPKKMSILEIELTEENDQVVLPPFLKIKKEVTDDPNYSNKEIARK